MKTVNFGKCITLFCLTCSLAFTSAYAIDLNPKSGVDECSRELLLSYFPEAFVNESLKKFNVPKDQWDAINKELTSKNDQVIKIVEEKAAKMDPNPLKDPSQRQQAVKIFRDTLFEVFAGVLRQHGVTDDAQIKSMLEDIQHQKAVRFAQCMDKNFPKQTDQNSVNPDAKAAAPAPLADAADEEQKVESKPAIDEDNKDKETAYGLDSQPGGYNRQPGDYSNNPHESIHSIVVDVDDNDDDVK